MVLDTRTCLLRDQDAIKAYVAELDPREQNQVEYVNTKRKTCQLNWSINFSGLQEHYIYLKEIYNEFYFKMIDLDILLNPDEEGNPENTTRRTPESNYNLDNKDIVRKISQVEEVLDSARDALIYFVTSLPAPEQVFMIQQATIPWLKDLDVIKAYVAEKPIVNAGDKGKEDDTTAVTTGENNMADFKIPE